MIDFVAESDELAPPKQYGVIYFILNLRTNDPFTDAL